MRTREVEIHFSRVSSFQSVVPRRTAPRPDSAELPFLLVQEMSDSAPITQMLFPIWALHPNSPPTSPPLMLNHGVKSPTEPTPGAKVPWCLLRPHAPPPSIPT